MELNTKKNTYSSFLNNKTDEWIDITVLCTSMNILLRCSYKYIGAPHLGTQRLLGTETIVFIGLETRNICRGSAP